MPDILNGHVDELLREAEQRLLASPAVGRPRLPQTVNRPVPAGQAAAATKEATKEELSVRIPQPRSNRKDLKKDSAGANWFNLPKTDLTPEFKRDWQLLRMRGLLDPKHQKKALRSTPPEYSHVGRVVAGPADFYSSRLTRKERKNTILEEVTSTQNGGKLKDKYAEIQRKKSSGKKAFYKRLVTQRRKRQN